MKNGRQDGLSVETVDQAMGVSLSSARNQSSPITGLAGIFGAQESFLYDCHSMHLPPVMANQEGCALATEPPKKAALQLGAAPRFLFPYLADPLRSFQLLFQRWWVSVLQGMDTTLKLAFPVTCGQ